MHPVQVLSEPEALSQSTVRPVSDSTQKIKPAPGPQDLESGPSFVPSSPDPATSNACRPTPLPQSATPSESPVRAVSDSATDIAPETSSVPFSEAISVPNHPSDRPLTPKSGEPVCRVCGEGNPPFIDIFSDEGQERQLLHKVHSTLPVQVQRDDGLPSQLCPGCTESVEAAFQLRERAAHTDVALRLALLRSAVAHTPVQAPPEQRGAADLLAPCTMTVGDLSDADSDDFSLAQEDLAALSIYDPSDNCDSEPDVPDNCDSALGGYAPSDNFDQEEYFSEPSESMEDASCGVDYSLLPESALVLDPVTGLLEPAAQTAAEDDSVLNSPAHDSVVETPADGSSLSGDSAAPAPSRRAAPRSQRYPVMFCTGSFHCETRSMEFPGPRMFKEHQRTDHGKKVQYCSLCYVFFEKKSLPGLLDHWLDLHEDLLQEHAPPHPDPKVQEEITFVRNALPNYLRPKRFKRQEYQCHMCSQIFPKSEYKAYIAHMKTERLTLSTLTCSMCEASFMKKSEYFYHMDHTHGQKRFECQICHGKYRIHRSYVEHLKTHQSKADVLCELCGKAFFSENHLRVHMKLHKMFSCLYCGKQMPSILRKRHLDRNHFSEKKFQCATCFQSFFSAAEMTQHREQHSEEEVECVVCGLRLKKLTLRMSHAALVAHMDKEHKHLATQRLTCPVTCCRTELPSVEALLQHCSGQHTEEQLHPTPAPEGSGIKTLLCTHCNSSFRNMSVYLNHVHNVLEESTESELPLTCNLCKASFPNEQELTSHLEGHPEAYSFWCRHCRQCFVSHLQRTQHEQIKHARFSQCKLCSAVFRMDRTLKKHMFTAHNLDAQSFQPLACATCGKIMCGKLSLRKHMVRQHVRMRQVICDECGKDFSCLADLRKHLFVHTRSPFFKCDMCDFSCHTITALTRHNRLKHTSDMLADNLWTS